MKIRHLHLPSGITKGIPLLIDADWTPEQAMAVVELLDDLRSQIWRHYELQLCQILQEQRSTHYPDADSTAAPDGELF